MIAGLVVVVIVIVVAIALLITGFNIVEFIVKGVAEAITSVLKAILFDWWNPF